MAAEHCRRPPGVPPSSPRRILIVDDQPASQEVQEVVRAVTSAGFEVEVLSDPDQLPERLGETPSGGLPAAVVVDLMLPDERGKPREDVGYRAVEAAARRPIIVGVLTQTSGRTAQAKRHGAQFVVEKHEGPTRLVDELQKAVNALEFSLAAAGARVVLSVDCPADVLSADPLAVACRVEFLIDGPDLEELWLEARPGRATVGEGEECWPVPSHLDPPVTHTFRLTAPREPGDCTIGVLLRSHGHLVAYTETTVVVQPRPLTYELPEALLAEHDALLPKKLGNGLSAEEAERFADLESALDEADAAQPLTQAILQQAGEGHGRRMDILRQIETLVGQYLSEEVD